MASPGQKRGACDHLMTAFDQHTRAICRDKGQGVDPCVYPCVLKQDSRYCDPLTSEHKTQLISPSYKLKKEQKNDKSDKDSGETITLIDPDLVSVVGSVKSTKSPEEVKEQQIQVIYPFKVHL